MRRKGLIWREFLAQHHLEGQTTEEKFEQLHVTRIIMNSPVYLRTRSNNKQESIMIEKERSLFSIPRKPRRKLHQEPSENDAEVEVVEPPTSSTEVNEILERMERDVQEEPLEKDSYFMHA